MALAVSGFPAIVKAGPKTKAVIVLGIDGMDPALLMRFIKEGRMPNCRRLMELGCFAPLGTSDPPQSPVAWSNFISGTNPGGHGIFDFIARDPATRRPHFSTARVSAPAKHIKIGGHVLPIGGRTVENLRKGPTFWNALQEQGIDCTVIRMPANFPPSSRCTERNRDFGVTRPPTMSPQSRASSLSASEARTLSGLGTPDIHGGYGIFTLFTDKAGESSRDLPGGRIEKVAINQHRVECLLSGPANSFDAGGKDIPVPLTIFIDPSNPVAKIVIQGRELLLNEGEWSDWIPLQFTLLPLVANVSGICRLYLKKARNAFALYVSPVNIDPSDPALPISTPRDYSRRLAEEIGPFYTQGMAEETHALSAHVFDDDEYRRQSDFVLREQVRLFEHTLNHFETGFFFHYFSALDLNSHAFWRAMDPGHPLYTPELAGKHGDFIPWLYGQMDRMVGQAMERLDGRTHLMVISDHGFGSFRRQFNLNSWLMDYGYAGPASGASRGNMALFGETDWTQTRAYGLGLNGLYLNMRGREADGIVKPGDESERLAGELIRHLTSVHDPETGERVISRVCRSSEIYSGPYVQDAPDLLVCYNRNYRASWDTILGSYPREHILDNTDPWSGDHALDSAFMPGVFLSNCKIRTETPALSDLAPTIMGEFGVPPAVGMTGNSIFRTTDYLTAKERRERID